jgi:(p)ppGpp synthase/HD superfamily hydrolase
VADRLNSRLAKAAAYTFGLFANDSRKGSQVPYVAHLFSVCALVQQDGGDDDEAIAGLLHDVLEDKPEEAPAATIANLWGPRVLDLIQVATDTAPGYAGGPKEPWQVRKERYLEHIRHASPADLRVTVADKVDNVRALVADFQRIGEKLFTRFSAPCDQQLWYYRSAVDAYTAAGFRTPLLVELGRSVAELESLVRPALG